VELPGDATVPLGLIVHELATNAVKYGAWHPKQNRRVSVEWSVTDLRELQFRWREHEVSSISTPVRQGAGSVLIRRSLAGATVDHDINPGGVDCRIVLPLG
jgi:two-component system, chemotaxis family, CheB/CheR fusion protein